MFSDQMAEKFRSAYNRLESISMAGAPIVFDCATCVDMATFGGMTRFTVSVVDPVSRTCVANAVHDDFDRAVENVVAQVDEHKRKFPDLYLQQTGPGGQNKSPTPTAPADDDDLPRPGKHWDLGSAMKMVRDEVFQHVRIRAVGTVHYDFVAIAKPGDVKALLEFADQHLRDGRCGPVAKIIGGKPGTYGDFVFVDVEGETKDRREPTAIINSEDLIVF